MTSAASHSPTSPRSPRRVSLEEWLRVPEEQRAELIDGKLVYQGMPGPLHGRAQARLASFVSDPFDRRAGGGDRPGGWWISMEVDLEIGGLGCRPDVLGWRRENHPALPEPDRRGLVTARPDWICEVLSPTTAHVDWGAKRLAYHRAGVAHYWLLDPHNGTLTVLRWSEEDYLVGLVTGRGSKVRAAPFEAVELDVGRVLGDDPDEPASPPEQPSAAAGSEAGEGQP